MKIKRSLTSMVVLVAVLVPAMVYAELYPISPRPLRKLIEESEFIVHVYVRDVKNLDAVYGRTEAVLVVREVLQGQINDSVIRIRYESNMICPAPPFFIKNADALVFLDKTNGRFSVPSLSYGTKMLTLPEIAVYKERIIEMQQIIKIENPDQKFPATTEWLVKCAENPATRYEGTYELSPSSNFMSFYDRDEKQPFEFTLTEDQKLRLKNALLSTDKPSYNDFGIIDLIYGRYKEEIFPYMLEKIKQLRDNDLWYAGHYMKRINLYRSTPRSLALAEEIEKESYSAVAPNKRKQMVLEFVTEIDAAQR